MQRLSTALSPRTFPRPQSAVEAGDHLSSRPLCVELRPLTLSASGHYCAMAAPLQSWRQTAQPSATMWSESSREPPERFEQLRLAGRAYFIWDLNRCRVFLYIQCNVRGKFHSLFRYSMDWS